MISSSLTRQHRDAPLATPYRDSHPPPLESQMLQLLFLCDATIDKQCNPNIGDPPQIQAIQLLLTLHNNVEQVCELWYQYQNEVQTRITALYDLMMTSEGCRWCQCPKAGTLCEPKEHYFVLVSLLQDLQIQCDRCPVTQ